MILTDQTKKNYTGIGQHTSTSYDPRTSKLTDNDYGLSRTYLGNYLNGKEHGIGFYKSRGGTQLFAGEFVENNATGLGIKLYVNENNTLTYDGKYCGEYKNNKRHGVGCWQFNNISFIGNFENNAPNGFGIMITWEGLKFIGKVSNFLAVSGKWYDQEDNEIDIIKLGYEKDGSKFLGKIEGNTGNGTLTYPDGRKYKGVFEYISKWQIKKGKCVWSDGRSYDGEWKNGKQNGYGITLFSDGTVYEGEWKDGNPHGKGTKTGADGSKYEGKWKDGVTIGQGTYTWSDGKKYVGEWKDGKRNGQGTWTHPNGSKYVGGFKDDKYNGQGTWTHLDGVEYVGEFKNGKKHGQGTETYSNGTKYVGEFKNGKYHNQGTLTKSNGEKYEGKWKDGVTNGQGTYTWSNGETYEGEYKDGKIEGQGTKVYPDGRKYVGQFKDGKRDGQGTFTNSDGEEYKGQWKDGGPIDKILPENG